MDVADQNFATFQVKDVVGERCQKLFQDFLEEFTVKGEIKYVAQALQLVRPEKNTLTVSYADLQKHNHQLATTIQQKYYRVYPYICRAVRNFAIDRVQVPAAKEFYVSFTNSSASVKIRALDNMAKIGTLVKVTGQVVRTHPVHPELVSGSFVCLECQTTIKDVEQQFKYTQPTICRNPVCKNRSRFLLDVNKSKFVDSQKIRIQEAQVELPRGSIPRSMEVILRAEAVESVQAGDQCEFTGTLIVVPDIDSLSMPGVCVECGTRLQGGGGQNVEGLGGLKALGVRDHSYKMAFLACTVERTNRKCGGLDPGKDDASPELRKMQMTEVEWQKVYRMSQDKSLCHNLCQSLFPTIHGNDEVKRGILLMLFGGVPKVTLEGTHLRGDINVCIVGDPSTGKSQLLKQVEKFSPWAVYTSGKASTAAGLTAAIVRDEESHEFVIEAGALMLADNGVCCIDDFDKMDPKDQLAIHEAMDQQTISITKAGVKATLNARTSILAAANPISGGYDRSKSLEQNIAMTTPIMSRFDLFFLLVDKCNEVTDNAIIRNIIERHSHHGSSVRGTYSADDIQRYITFARQLKPKISRDSAELIVKEYKRLRQRDTSGATKSAWRITVRHLESLIRLSEAMGRMYCQKEVQPKHVKEAFRLLEKSVIRVKQLEEGEPEEPLVEVEGFRLNAPQASAPVSNPGFFGAKPAAPVPGFGNPSNATAPAGSSPFTFTGQQPAAPPAPGVQKLNATYDAAVTRPSPVHINVVVFGQPAAVTAPRLLNSGAGSNTQSKPAGVPTLSAKPSDAASKPDVMPSLSQRGSKRSMDDDGVGSMRGRSGSAKDRTNIGMREQFTLVEGVSQSTAHSKTRVVGGQHRDGSQASRAPSAIGHTSSSATGTIGKKSGASISSHPHQKSKVSSDVKVGQILSKPGLPAKVKTQGHTHDRGSSCLEVFRQPASVTAPRLLSFGAGSNTQSKPAGVPTLSAKPSDAASKPDVMPSLSQRGSKRSMDDDGVGSMRGRSGSAKDRTNIGMREQFTLVEGVSQSTAHSKTRVVGGQHRDGSQASRAPSAIGHTSSSATGTIGKKSGASISSRPHQKSKVSSDVKVGEILSKPGLPEKVKTQGHTYDRGSPCLEGLGTPERVYPTRSELEKEVQTNVQCPVDGCVKIFRHPSALQMHLVKLHRQIVTESDARLAKRLKPEAKKPCKFYCPESGCRFNGHQHLNSSKSLREHFLRLHAPRKLGCSICGKKYGLSQDLKRHKTQCHLKPWCLSCHVRMGSWTILAQHLRLTGHKGLDGQCFEDVNGAEMPDQHGMRGTTSQKACSDRTAVSQVSTTVRKGKSADRKKRSQDTRPRTIPPAPPNYMCGGYHATFGHSTALAGDQHLASSAVSLSSISRPPLLSVVDRASAVPCSKMQPSTSRGSSGPSSASCSSLTKRSAPMPSGGYSSSDASKAIYPGKVVDQPVVTPSKKRCIERKNTCEPGDGPQIQGTFFGCG